MKQQPWDKRVKPIFLEAMHISNPHDQSVFLDEVCGDDQHLRQTVARLLNIRDNTSANPLDEAMKSMWSDGTTEDE